MNKPNVTAPSLDGFTQADWDEVSDNPELTDEELASLRPAAEVLPPALYAAMIRSSDARREATDATVRLDPDVLAHFRATGPDWQARVNTALRASIETPKAR